MILSKKWFYLFLSSFLFINLLVMFFKPVYIDASVYWFYAHHLRWIYQDAPPLIGVVTWVGITIFGSHVATLNGLALGSILISAWFLYYLARSIFDEDKARISVLIFLLTPATLHYFFRWTWSYNDLILMFWIMTLYFFHEAGKTKAIRYFYLTALGLSGAILSQISSGALILTLAVILLVLPTYRTFFKNKHFYFSLLLIALIISPYIIALIHSGFAPVKFLTMSHDNNVSGVFSFHPLAELMNDIAGEMNLFFALGALLIAINFKAIIKNERLKFCLLSSGIFFLLALLASIKYEMPMRYYFSFYFGFILLFISFVKGRWAKWLMLAIYINFALLAVDSLNVIAPQYGIGTPGSSFDNNNAAVIGREIKNAVQPQDFLISCNSTSSFYRLAFDAGHSNTYVISSNLFIWQAPIQQVLEQNKENKIFYLCDAQTLPPQNLGLTCGVWQTLSSSIPEYLKHRVHTDTYYLSQCTYKKQLV